MAHDRFDEHHSFNVLGFIQLLYDTTCANTDFWVKPVWGLGCMVSRRDIERPHDHTGRASQLHNYFADGLFAALFNVRFYRLSRQRRGAPGGRGLGPGVCLVGGAAAGPVAADHGPAHGQPHQRPHRTLHALVGVARLQRGLHLRHHEQQVGRATIVLIT